MAYSLKDVLNDILKISKGNQAAFEAEVRTFLSAYNERIELISNSILQEEQIKEAEDRVEEMWKIKGKQIREEGEAAQLWRSNLGRRNTEIPKTFLRALLIETRNIEQAGEIKELKSKVIGIIDALQVLIEQESGTYKGHFATSLNGENIEGWSGSLEKDKRKTILLYQLMHEQTRVLKIWEERQEMLDSYPIRPGPALSSQDDVDGDAVYEADSEFDSESSEHSSVNANEATNAENGLKEGSTGQASQAQIPGNWVVLEPQDQRHQTDPSQASGSRSSDSGVQDRRSSVSLGEASANENSSSDSSSSDVSAHDASPDEGAESQSDTGDNSAAEASSTHDVSTDEDAEPQSDAGDNSAAEASSTHDVSTDEDAEPQSDTGDNSAAEASSTHDVSTGEDAEPQSDAGDNSAAKASLTHDVSTDEGAESQSDTGDNSIAEASSTHDVSTDEDAELQSDTGDNSAAEASSSSDSAADGSDERSNNESVNYSNDVSNAYLRDWPLYDESDASDDLSSSGG